MRAAIARLAYTALICAAGWLAGRLAGNRGLLGKPWAQSIKTGVGHKALHVQYQDGSTGLAGHPPNRLSNL